MFSNFLHSPYRLLLAAAVMAALLTLFPVRGGAPRQESLLAAGEEHTDTLITPPPEGQAASADLSERTSDACMLHKTLYYAPCGHSVQRREAMPVRLKGLSRQALEAALGEVLPGATVTGFSAAEVDVALNMPCPCPLHWVLKVGENGCLAVMHNRLGEALEIVRQTDIPLSGVQESERQALTTGRVFDDVQALEGYLESLSS